MKNILLVAACFFVQPSFSQSAGTPNVFIITTDGFRWQEIFNGADSALINDTHYVTDTGALKQLFWSDDAEARKKLLMPFVWNTLVKKGTVYGNRRYANKVAVANPYRFSYAGYNELLTGYADPQIIANRKKWNPNENVLAFLNRQPECKDRVAAFTSWNLFTYIFNARQHNLYLNSGYQPVDHDELSDTEILANGVQQYAVDTTESTRNDMLTFVTAKAYILAKHPKVVYIGFGETDTHAHGGRYDEYLQSAHLFDEYLAQLWYLVNKDPFYKNNTNFIITTDHGRGRKSNSWVRHNMFTGGSNATWLMTMGPAFTANGEMKTAGEIFNQQVAQTIANIMGYNFNPAHTVADALAIQAGNNK